MNKLFKNDYPLILNKIELSEKEVISHVSEATFWSDRAFFCYITNLGNITVNWVALPTEIDPQIHIESVQLTEFSNSLMDSLKIPNFIQMTKSLLFSSESDKKGLKVPNKLCLVKIKSLERKCEDKYALTLTAVHADKFIYGSFTLQDKWHTENNRYVKLEKNSYWEIDLVNIVSKFDQAHLAPNDLGKTDTPVIELFDYIPYEIGTNIQILAVYRAHYPDSKLARKNRISIQHINIRRFKKSERRVTQLKFATTLKTLGSDAKYVRVSIQDYMKKFVYTIQWKDRHGLRSCLLRTCENVFNYNECEIPGSILGIGARDVNFGPGYKVFVASDQGFFEEKTSFNFEDNAEDLVQDSLRASSFRGRNSLGYSGKLGSIEEPMTIN